mgnify:CR=1 FL=1
MIDFQTLFQALKNANEIAKANAEFERRKVELLEQILKKLDEILMVVKNGKS